MSEADPGLFFSIHANVPCEEEFGKWSKLFLFFYA